ncbi:hypothetical protein [Streptomyces sp. NPDC050164]|uniref:hypothetical protein n=1 Tax=Streptomyces sp. NPDC050164 TaxID=3365605 RepID=UPI00379E00F9
MEHVAELRPAVQAAAFVAAQQHGAAEAWGVPVSKPPVKVEELPGSLQVPANSVLADAEKPTTPRPTGPLA